MFTAIKRGHADMIRQLDPYALLTVQPNWPSNSYGSAGQAYVRLKYLMKDLSLRMDQQFIGTRHVVERCLPAQRFEALCFAEKLLGNPHAHCLMCLPPEATPALSAAAVRDEKQRRLRFLLTAVATEPLGPAEELLVRGRSEPWSRKCAPIVKPLLASCVSDVRIINRLNGLPEYVLKEYNSNRAENMTDYFFLSEFHKQN